MLKGRVTERVTIAIASDGHQRTLTDWCSPGSDVLQRRQSVSLLGFGAKRPSALPNLAVSVPVKSGAADRPPQNMALHAFG